MKRKKILLDVDEVICFSGFLEAVNEFLGTNYLIDDFTDYYIDEVAIPEDQFEDFKRFAASRNNYENPQFLPGAIETIEQLSEYYDIFICSSCVNPFYPLESGEIFKNKFNFLVEYLPFINPENFIFTTSKQLIKGDIIIDDVMSHLSSDIEIKILFPSYHNRGISDRELEERNIIRGGRDWRNGWEEVKRILLDEKML